MEQLQQLQRRPVGEAGAYKALGSAVLLCESFTSKACVFCVVFENIWQVELETDSKKKLSFGVTLK